MKTIDKLVLAACAMLVASAFAVGTEPRDEAGHNARGET